MSIRAAPNISTDHLGSAPARSCSYFWSVLRRVGLNLLYLVPRQVGGTEIYARRLIAALGRERPDVEFICFCGSEAAAVLPDPEWPPNVRIVHLPVRAVNKPLRLATELGRLPDSARRHGVQVLHSLGTTTPLTGRFARVTTVHDLIYDHFPAAFPATSRLGLRLLVPRGARRSARVQVSSCATRNEVVERFGLDPERVDVVPLGGGMRDVAGYTPAAVLRERLGLDSRPVVLSVNAALPHKNLDRLIRALTLVDGDPALVLVGHAGRDSDRLAALTASLGLRDRVQMTGWLEDEDLEGLYRLADAFVYPSLYEGFGIPVLEAMRRGVPVACSDATSLPEVAGDAARYFDPTSVEDIAAATTALLSDHDAAASLVRRGRERAARFSWENSALTALASYERALPSAL